MAPPRHPGSPPALMDDLVREILLRIPPDEPAHLVRAALVCKPWLRILSNPAFLRRYRVFHRAPPLLGFLHNLFLEDYGAIPRFVSVATASPCSAPAFGCHSWWALDSRHGRVLIHAFGPMSLVVWDPITGGHQHLPLPGYPHAYCTGAVLCAAAGCDHLDCRGGPFKVVFVGTDDVEGVTWASEYSSETGAWSASTTVDFDSYVEMRPGLLAGDALYFTLESSLRVLKYDLGGRVLSVIDAPEVPGGIVMTAEGGGLGFAGVEDYSLYLWSWEVGPEGIAGWVQRRVIELDKLLPIPAILVSLDVIGFAEGTDIIFMSTDVGVFTIEHKSGRVRKVGESGAFYTIVPYMSFYTPDHAWSPPP